MVPRAAPSPPPPTSPASRLPSPPQKFPQSAP
jgi:hypothetical protein